MTKLKLKQFLVIILIISLTFVTNIQIKGENISPSKNVTSNNEVRAVKEWTLMLYFCADTRSETVTPSIDNSGNFIHAELAETMMKITTTDLLPGSITDLNVLVLYDYPYTFQDKNGRAVIYQLRTGQDGGNTIEAEWGPVNMGDPDTLSDFVFFCKTNFPANNYALVLSDHGRGYAGYCYDYHAPHPYWEYAIGDCLTVPELEYALSGTNNVDVLIFNTCLGASFEMAWQLVGEVSYVVAGESTQGSSALQHPREIAYALSRDLTMTPKELAQAAFDGAVTPIVVPSYYDWPTMSLIDLTKFNVSAGAPSFMDTFDSFTQKLVDEIDYSSAMIPYFRNFRSNMTTKGLHSTESLMVDLTNFIEEIIANKTDFHYIETGDLATLLLSYLTENSNGLLVEEFHETYYDDCLNGFSLCFPDSYDMYQGFMYPNLYENFRISLESSWWAFISKLYPLLSFDKFKLKDFYEIQLFVIDPSVRLDIFYNPYETPDRGLHVGLNDDFSDENMGIELGISGSEFCDDLLGNVMIRIPTSSVQLSKATGSDSFTIVINATSAASASQEVNLKVKHVSNDEVVWQEIQESDIEVGQQLVCDVSTDDEITDFELEQFWTNTTENTAFIGTNKGITNTIISITFTVLILVTYRRKLVRKK